MDECTGTVRVTLISNKKGRKMKRIKTGQLHPEGKDAVFLAIVAYTTLTDRFETQAGQQVPILLMQSRWSNDLGLPGGKVDEGETLIEALHRECKEEVNYKIGNKVIEPVCSHSIDGKMNTHLYLQTTSEKGIKKIMKKAMKAEHFGEELGGTMVVFLEDFGRGKGIEKLLNTSLASTVQEGIGVLCIEQLKTSAATGAICLSIVDTDGLVISPE